MSERIRQPIYNHANFQIGWVTDCGSKWFATECYFKGSKMYFQHDSHCLSHPDKDYCIAEILDAQRKRLIRKAEAEKLRQQNNSDVYHATRTEKGFYNVNEVAVALSVKRNDLLKVLKKLNIAKWRSGSYNITLRDIEKIRKIMVN